MSKRKTVISKVPMSKKEAYERMVLSKGIVFGVQFIKKDGSVRKMSCRTRVQKGLTGKGMRYVPITKGLFGAYDMNNGYRQINLKTLQEVQFNGVRYKVNPYSLVFDF